jgi:hypothetical protein
MQIRGRYVPFAALFALLLGCGRVSAQAPGLPPLISRNVQSVSDPTLGIRQVLIPPERVPQELESAKQKRLIQIPRREFEIYLQAALRAEQARQAPARLLSTSYRAVLTESDLRGTALWTVSNPTAIPSALTVEPLNLALQDPQLNKAPAVMGELKGRSLQLLVERQGTQLFQTGWTARGEKGPDGVRFDIGIPACNLSSFELDLPSNCKPVLSSESILLSGPFAGTQPDRRTWRLACGGSSQINLLIRRTSDDTPANRLILVRAQARHTITMDEVDVAVNLELEVPQGGILEIVCEHAPELIPLRVTSRQGDIEWWKPASAGTGSTNSAITIHLREPFDGRSLQVRLECRAASPLNQNWNCPGFSVRGAVSLSESISLHIAPALQIANWNPGDFVLANAVPGGDGAQTLLLESGLAGETPKAGNSGGSIGPLRRPSARVRRLEERFRVQQVEWWHVDRDRSTLSVDLFCEDTGRGPIRLRALLPAGWRLDRVESYPPALVQGWSTQTDASGVPELAIDLDRATQSRAGYRLRLDLSTEPNQAAALLGPAFPQVIVKQARAQEGFLAIRVANKFRAAIETALPTASLRELEGVGTADTRLHFDPNTAVVPWSENPDQVYRFDGEAPLGRLLLETRYPRVRARCTTNVVVAPGSAAATVRLHLRPELGQPNQVDFYVGAPLPSGAIWKSLSPRFPVHSVERLHAADSLTLFGLLGAPSALNRAVFVAQPHPTGNSWRITFAAPLSESVTIETTWPLTDYTRLSMVDSPIAAFASNAALGTTAFLELAALRASANRLPARWRVPLVSVPAAESLEGKITVRVAGAGLVQGEWRGLEETAADPDSGAGNVWKSFRYRSLPASLDIVERTPIVAQLPQPRIDRAALTTYVVPGERKLSQRYGFEVQNWNQRILPVQLPKGALFAAARIDGRWIDSSSTLNVDDRTIVHLPAIGDDGAHLFEIYYTCSFSPGRLWTEIAIDKPVLPLEPLAFTQKWNLPPVLIPAFAPGLQRSPISANRLGRIFESLAIRPSGWTLAEWKSEQERLLSSADLTFPARLGAKDDLTLGEALRFLAFEVLGVKQTLWIDATALSEQAITPSAALPNLQPSSSFSEQGIYHRLQKIGVVCVPSPAGPLVTTRTQASRNNLMDLSDSENHCDLVEWLLPYDQPLTGTTPYLAASELARWGHFDPANRLESWIEWSLPVATTDGAYVIIVDRHLLLAASVGLSIALLFSAWRLRQRPGTLYRLVSAWLLASVVGFLCLPRALSEAAWFPLLTSLVIALGWYAWCGIRLPKAVNNGVVTRTVGLLMVVVLPLCLSGRADAPSTRTVFVLQGSKSTAGNESVLLPPELLTELKSLSQEKFTRTALLRSRYLSTATANGVEFQADFQAYSFANEPAELSLPLGGVEMNEILVDGNAALPETPGGPDGGYRLSLSGKGVHSIRCRFRALDSRTGLMHEVTFAIPPLAESVLELTAPGRAQFLHTALARGAQTANSNAAGTQLKADLGRVNHVHVRWFEEAAAPTAGNPSVREFYYWDIRNGASRLFGVLQYQNADQANASYLVNLPDGLLVRRVEVMSLRTASAIPHLSTWRVIEESSRRRLRLDFQYPVTSPLQLSIEFILAQPLGYRPVLPIPSPDRATSIDGFIAYRLEGRQAVLAEHRRVTGIEPSAFAAMWRLAGSEDPGIPDGAFSFRRSGDAAPFVQLELRPWQSLAQCAQNLTWKVSPTHATLDAVAKLALPGSNLIFIEWLIPESVRALDLTGPGIRYWSQSGSRIEIWLERPVAAAEFHLRATAACQTGSSPRFVLPTVYFPGIATQSTAITVIPEHGFAVSPVQLQGLTVVPVAKTAVDGVSLLADKGAYGGAIKIVREPEADPARSVMLLEFKNHGLQLSAEMDVHFIDRKAQTLVARLTNWPGPAAEMSVSPPLPVHPERTSSGLAWRIEHPDAGARLVRLTINGHVPLGSDGAIPAPALGLDGQPQSDRLLVLDNSLSPEGNHHGLSEVGDVGLALKNWPAYLERARLGAKAYRIGDSAESIEIRPKALAQTSAPPVAALAQEHAAAMVNNGHWLYTTKYLLYQHAATEVVVGLPPDAVLVAMMVDGNEIMPFAIDESMYQLSMAGRSRARALAVVWKYPVRGEETEGLLLDAPGLYGPDHKRLEVSQSRLWTVFQPAGRKLVPETGGALEQSAALLSVQRADAQLSLCTIVAPAAEQGNEESRKQLQTARSRLREYCRYAEHCLIIQGDRLGTSDVADQLEKLRSAEKELAERYRLTEPEPGERILAPPEQSIDQRRPTLAASALNIQLTDAFFQDGTPTYWSGKDNSQVPRLQLTSTVSVERRQRLGLSSLVIVLTLLAWMLSYYPRATGWLMRFSPEQFMLAACVAWAVLGLNWLVVLLFTIGLSARLVYLAGWVFDFLRRPRGAVAASGSAVAAGS